MRRRTLTLLLLMIGILGWFFVNIRATSATPIQIVIPSGATARSVTAILESSHAVSCGICYRFYGLLNSAVERPKPGTFQIPAGSSYSQIARLIALGPAREEVTVRIQEGWDLTEIANALSMYGMTSSTIRSAATSDRFPDSPVVKNLPAKTSLEGYLYPDTYRVYRDQLPEGLLTKQLSTFNDKMSDLEAEAIKDGKNVHDILTLASIIEREVPVSDDRKIVSGIFWNRLKIGMPLQSDATVNYVTRAYHARPTAADLNTLSPYNTYLHRGLPPGPIGNPSRDAVDAALHPTSSEFLYFLTDPHGKLYLAKTLEEHIRNKLKAFQSP